jgi:hypothetical protein
MSMTPWSLPRFAQGAQAVVSVVVLDYLAKKGPRAVRWPEFAAESSRPPQACTLRMVRKPDEAPLRSFGFFAAAASLAAFCSTAIIFS